MIKILKLLALVLPIAAAVIAPAWYLAEQLAGIRAEISSVRGEVVATRNDVAGLRRESADQNNPYSLKAAVASNTAEVRSLAQTLFAMAGRLNSNQLAIVEQYRMQYFGSSGPGTILPLPIRPAQNPGLIYARPSRVAGMIAITLPPEHLGKSVPVQAMSGGKVVSITKDEAGLEVLDIAVDLGYLHRYGSLSKVTTTVGASVARLQVIGSAIPTREVCIRIGILDPAGHFIDPRPFLPPMMKPDETLPK